MRPVRVYINVAVINHVNFILNQLLDSIEKSGLYDICEEINLIVNGDINVLNYKSLDKIKSTHYRNDISHCEFPTLQKIYRDSLNADFNVLYLHTKGVTRYNKPIEDWTNYMLYFNVTKFEDRLNELKNHDCTGVNLWGDPKDLLEKPDTWGYGKSPQHYSGNFWWSNSSHIEKLNDPYQWIPNQDFIRYRIMAEMWLCQRPESKYFNAWSSDVDHYRFEYPLEKYSNNKIFDIL